MIQSQGVGRCFALRTLVIAVLVTTMACVLRPLYAPAAGVTIITHGLDGDVDDWVISMANQMTAYYRFPGNYSTCYELYFTPSGSSYTLTWARIGGIAPTATDSGEILIKLDWRQLADGNSYSTVGIAPAIVPRLLQADFIPEMNGHALAELPIHLIGHSRGGSLVCEISKLLGQNGVWVDHLTTLDPHPLNNDGFNDLLYSAVDAPARTYENVLFHDNYFQWLNVIAYGEPVAGAYVRRLTYLDGGYYTLTASHSDVHLWYHGTIDSRIPANDSVVLLTSAERQTWWTSYETYGTWGGRFAGFYYSLIGGGDRLSSDQPAGPGTGRVFDGYNQRWNFGVSGTDNRTSLPSNNGSWPNLIRFNITGTNTVAQGEVVALKYSFQNTQPATVTIFLDDDWNPYNGNVRQVTQYTESGHPVSEVWNHSVELGTTTIAPRNYAVYARITAGGRSRYLYTPEILTVRPPPCSYTIAPAERLHTGDAGNGSITVTARTNCDWVANSSCDWVHITTGVSGTGNGIVSYSIDANPTNTARTCVLTVASQMFTVRQRAGFCTFTITPTNAFHGPVAEGGVVNIMASSPADCGWAATPDCDWVHIDAAPSGNLSYSLDNNPNCIPRSCTIFVAGQTFTVNQAAGSGTFLIAPLTRSHGPGAATGSVSVTAGIACGWTATNNDDWISITAGTSGIGNGLVSYIVQANSELTGRTGTVTIAGSTFTVVQAPDRTRPMVSIIEPLANARFTNAQIVLTGGASDDLGLALVEYQLGTNEVMLADGTISWMAPLELVPGTNTVRVWCRDLSGNISTTNTRSFFYSRVPLSKGTYTGLFHEADGFRFGSSGVFKLTVTDKLTYSGSLLAGGKAHSVSGKFNPDGTATNAVVRGGTNVMIVSWKLEAQSLGTITGTVSGANWQAGLSGDRAEFNTKANPARQAGKFTFTIAGKPDATNEPEGDGFGTAIVDGNGKVTVSGTLAEGTKFAQSATLSANGRWPLFALLYANKGSVVSWMSFDPMETNRFNGVLNWFKPPLLASKYYPNEFANTNLITGSRYVAPSGTTNRILSITNGSIILSGGNRPASITNAVIVGMNNRVTNASPNKLTLTFSLASGLFNGTFVETGTVKKVLFKGAVMQSLNGGSGFYLGTNQSGRVTLQPSP